MGEIYVFVDEPALHIGSFAAEHGEHFLGGEPLAFHSAHVYAEILFEHFEKSRVYFVAVADFENDALRFHSFKADGQKGHGGELVFPFFAPPP